MSQTLQERIAILTSAQVTKRNQLSDAEIARTFQEIIDADLLTTLPGHVAAFAQCLAEMGVVKMTTKQTETV